MKIKEADTAFTIESGKEFHFSGDALAELLQATLATGTSFRFKVKGFSMTPFIRDNDVVTVSPLLNPLKSFGKMAAFINPETEKLVIHRIVGRDRAGYILKGDNCPQADGVVLQERILGYVTKMERNNRKSNLGLGPERYVIAVISRRTMIFPFLLYIWKCLRFAKVKGGIYA
ncbi:MAG: S24/S26 family peptidase [Candidatus Omnitrophica bacterium]|nr:S24/S26 family peptidase [Candidatus Omnitrophota bacterium]